ncbi:MAG: hypothetical protein ACFFCV_02530 [Promethearchaeota archaeon]
MTRKNKNSVFTSIGGDKNNSMGALIKSTYEKWDKIEIKRRKRRNINSNHNVKTTTIKDLKSKRVKRKRKKKPKVKSKEKYQKVQGRSEGDQIIYYILHSILGSFLFIMIAIYLDFFRFRGDSIGFLFSIDFILTILAIFIWSIITNFIGRIVAHFILQLLYRRTVPKTFFELNSTGLNRYGIRYLLATLIASIIFTTGMVYILQYKLFGNSEFLSLIFTYVIIKFFIFIITKMYVQSKL